SLIIDAGPNGDGFSAISFRNRYTKRKSDRSFVNIYRVFRELKFAVRAFRIDDFAKLNARSRYSNFCRDRVFAGRTARIYVQSRGNMKPNISACGGAAADRTVRDRTADGLCR